MGIREINSDIERHSRQTYFFHLFFCGTTFRIFGFAPIKINKILFYFTPCLSHRISYYRSRLQQIGCSCCCLGTTKSISHTCPFSSREKRQRRRGERSKSRFRVPQSDDASSFARGNRLGAAVHFYTRFRGLSCTRINYILPMC